jgi:alpha-galactosidase
MKTNRGMIVASLACAVGLNAAAAESFWLADLDLRVNQDWGEPQRNLSVDRKILTIGGKKFDHGLGTHANSLLRVALGGTAEQFTAQVGVDDEVPEAGSVAFTVAGDGKTLWESGAMKKGDASKEVSVDLHGVRTLVLSVSDAGDGISYDHADWGDAKIVMSEGQPRMIAPTNMPAMGILTPKPGPAPRINGAKVFGVRPGHPFLFTVAATGDRPMTYAADNLPSGLRIDPATGFIRGTIKDKGEYKVTLRAKNAVGEAKRDFKIVCGELIGLTPAMGWNSWNVFGRNVSDQLARTAADAMVKDGPYGRLIDHGWTYINLDDGWERAPVRENSERQDALHEGPTRDEKGRFITNSKFPDMKALGDYIHGKGLKFGIYSGPGARTCQGLEASYQHELIDAQTWAGWGVDYLKYDWCSYDEVANREAAVRLGTNAPNAQTTSIQTTNTTGTTTNTAGRRGRGPRLPLVREEHVKPYRIMGEALETVPRDIIYSLCQYGRGEVWEWGADVGGNSWRTTGDITDTWNSLSTIGFRQGGHEKWVGPGHFDDPDMLIVGKVGWNARLRDTRLNSNELYTHITLWSLLASPLLMGCDMARLDEFTLNLLCNDEVLAVNQDPLARQGSRISQNAQLEVWAKDLEDGSKAVGLFNRSDDDATMSCKWSDLKISGKQSVRDLWRQKPEGFFDNEFAAAIPRHGALLFKITPVK